MTPPTITSLQNPRVKSAVRLRDGRHREKQSRILIDGTREIARALQGRVHPAEVFVCEPLCESEDARHLLADLPDCGAELIHVTPAVFEKLAFGARTDGLVAVAPTPRRTFADVTLPADPLVAVLEGVEKPGNLGAVVRTADAAGLAAVILADGRTDVYNPNAIRASLGTIFTLPVVPASTAETLDWLRAQNIAVYAARPDATTSYTHVDYRGPAAVVLGSEAAGLTPAWSTADVTPVSLPMLGTADSLNVSTTAAVLFYEALRQRTVGQVP